MFYQLDRVYSRFLALFIRAVQRIHHTRRFRILQLQLSHVLLAFESSPKVLTGSKTGGPDPRLPNYRPLLTWQCMHPYMACDGHTTDVHDKALRGRHVPHDQMADVLRPPRKSRTAPY